MRIICESFASFYILYLLDAMKFVIVVFVKNEKSSVFKVLKKKNKDLFRILSKKNVCYCFVFRCVAIIIEKELLHNCIYVGEKAYCACCLRLVASLYCTKYGTEFMKIREVHERKFEPLVLENQVDGILFAKITGENNLKRKFAHGHEDEPAKKYMKVQSSLEVYRVGLYPGEWICDETVELWDNLPFEAMTISDDSDFDDDSDVDASELWEMFNRSEGNYYGEFVLPYFYNYGVEITPPITPELSPERRASYSEGEGYSYSDEYNSDGSCITISDDDSVGSIASEDIMSLFEDYVNEGAFGTVTLEDLIDLLSEGL